jgi:integrase
MPVIAIRNATAAAKPAASTSEKAVKSVPATQKAVDALPFDSGAWRVAGIPGLYVRCRAKTKSFYIQRRVDSELVRRNLGAMPMKDAKDRATSAWADLKQKRAPGQVTFSEAFARYMEQKSLAEATVTNYRLNFRTLLNCWHDRTLRDIGGDREGMRILQQRIKKENGPAKANQVVRLVSAVYNWQRKIDPTLPETPTTAVELASIAARDWAYSDEQLRAWWHAIEKTKEGKMERGVKTLSPLKRAYWLTALLTGARPRSIEHLRWPDVDLEGKAIRFRVTKGDRPYSVPMSDALRAILKAYKNCNSVPPSDWVFPSPTRAEGHLVDVKNIKEGVSAKYHLRHTFRTTLTALGITGDQIRLLMGHSLGGDVSSGYISAPLLVESLRPAVNALAAQYLKILGVTIVELFVFA